VILPQASRSAACSSLGSALHQAQVEIRPACTRQLTAGDVQVDPN